MAVKLSVAFTANDVNRLQKMLIQDTATNCLLWTGCKLGNGYGVMSVGGVQWLVHRLAWLYSGRTITADKPLVLHSCDNPACCEPTHLRTGTASDNSRDMAIRDRGSIGKFPYGVSRNGKRFMATVRTNNQTRYIGTFDTVEEAHNSAVTAKRELYELPIAIVPSTGAKSGGCPGINSDTTDNIGTASR